jgi:hypothetical protein
VYGTYKILDGGVTAAEYEGGDGVGMAAGGRLMESSLTVGINDERGTILQQLQHNLPQTMFVN